VSLTAVLLFYSAFILLYLQLCTHLKQNFVRKYMRGGIGYFPDECGYGYGVG